MRLTPMDIHHKEFRHAIRGYSEEEVDDFLDEVVAEFERLFKENIDLKEQMEHVREKMSQYENMEETLRNTLITAQKSAEDVHRNAKREAELIIKDSELKAKEVVQNAEMQRQELEKKLTRLTQAEEEFRSKFKGLLESYLRILGEAPTPPEIKVEEAAPEEVPVAQETATQPASENEEMKEEAVSEPQEEKEEEEGIHIVEEATKQESEDLGSAPSYFATDEREKVEENPFRKNQDIIFEDLGDEEDLIYRID